MTKINKPLLVFCGLLTAAVLACSLANPPGGGAARADLSTVAPTPPGPSLAPLPAETPKAAGLANTPTPPHTCQVATGQPAGVLNLRAGPGVAYPVLAWLTEGQTITPTRKGGGGWLLVQAAGLQGWVYSSFTTCEVKP